MGTKMDIELASFTITVVGVIELSVVSVNFRWAGDRWATDIIIKK